MTSGNQQAVLQTSGSQRVGLASRIGVAQGRLLWAILALSVALRVATALYLGDSVVELPGTADQISYHSLALRVVGGYGFSFGQNWWPMTAAGAPTAHWSFLYTFYLAAVYAIFGPHPLVARLIQAVVVGLLQPYLVFKIAGQLMPALTGSKGTLQDRPEAGSSGKTVPLLAAGITAVYAYFVYYAATLMTEPFYITAILGSLYLFILLRQSLVLPAGSGGGKEAGKLVLGLGVTLAVTVLLRQLFLICVPVLCLWLLLTVPAGVRGRVVGRLAVSLAVIVLAILPFTAYNYARFGHFVLLNTNAGFAFFWANHPIYGTKFESILPAGMGTYGELIPPELANLDEAALDRALLGRGLGFIAEDPGRYLKLSLSRTVSYFKFWPSGDSAVLSNIVRVGSFGLFLPFMLYGLLLSFRAWRDPLPWLMYSFVAAYTLMHLLSWTLIRYRLPVDAVLVIFAAYGICDIWRRLASLVTVSRRRSAA